jgi:hypothetical protein
MKHINDSIDPSQQKKEINDTWKWSKNFAKFLRFSFNRSESIVENFSQAWQDLFILSMLNGKRQGTYLEIGGHDPVANNNTFLLHKDFSWTGISIEIDTSHFQNWRQFRPANQIVIADALSIDYNAALPLWFRNSTSRRIDYLQLDIDPSINTLNVLKILPLDEWRFSVITFETDAYTGDYRARDESRAILESYGYVNIGKDISVLFPPISENPIPFEDWWVDPNAIEDEKIIVTKNVSATLPQQIIFKQD